MLYYLGVMQWLVQKIGFVLQTIMDTTAAESMNAAGNIFIGQVSIRRSKEFTTEVLDDIRFVYSD